MKQGLFYSERNMENTAPGEHEEMAIISLATIGFGFPLSLQRVYTLGRRRMKLSFVEDTYFLG